MMPVTVLRRAFRLYDRPEPPPFKVWQEHVPVQPDAVCEVGGSTPGLSHGDLGIFLGGGQTEEFVH